MSRPAAHPRPRRPGADSYDDIEPAFTELAALDPGAPARERMREDIICRCLPLGEHIASRFSGRGEPTEDLRQVASLGVVLAVDRFDVTQGTPFVAFAVPTIMGEVRRHFRDRTWAVQVPRPVKELQQRLAPAIETLLHRNGRMPTARELAAELDADLHEITQAMLARNGYHSDSLDALHTDSDGETSDISAAVTLGANEPCYDLLENAIAVRPLIAALPERDRNILIWRFFDGLTQRQIADRVGCSQMHVSRILTRVLNQLREQALAEPTPTPA
ncbi:SigB/SigF/SigG family RNA polymerase sigma factor [Nocardia sp. NPDC050697]|uniref:SigB/SigF/SigG family RNA polymerase sigma factor n=1 Tax=Nocardia sp. NPDC050697 TaxID=3155158 RepID=UPI0033F4FF2D